MEIKPKWERDDIILTNPLITQEPDGPRQITFHGICVDGGLSYTAVPKVEKVIFQKTHTIVLWKNKTKTIVNCSEEDFDKEKGLAMAIAKKIMPRGEFKKLLENADIQDK